MPERKESSITFTVEESIWFERGQEVDELISISLSPHIELLNEEDYVVLKGTLELSGEYKHVNEENEVAFPIMGRQYIQSVEIRNETESEFFHQLPLDITIPKRKVKKLEDIAVDIESFDYHLSENCRLQLLADIEIRGVYEEEESILDTVEEDADDLLDHYEESPSRVEPATPINNESSVIEEIDRKTTELQEEELEEILLEVQPGEHEVEAKVREAELQGQGDEQQEIQVETREGEQQEIQVETREGEQQEIQVETREGEQQEIQVETREGEQRETQVDTRENDQQEIQMEAVEKEERNTKVEAQEEQHEIELETLHEEHDIHVEVRQEEQAHHQVEGAREKQQDPLVEILEKENDEDFYDLFKIEANIIPEKRELTDVRPTLDYHLPKLPEISIESLERRGRDHMPIESSSPYIESSSHMSNVKYDEVESSSHLQEEKNKEKKKKDKYKSMSFADFFARKDEGASAKLKVCLVQHGDSIQGLADKYKVTVQQILRANQLEANHEVYEGQVLYIPVKVSSLKSI
ncbi:LysM peptidoglycan-binding domain-containing protein [Lederbergia lenta]|uniref:LysM peptidoglycan-binding domain-containing protein n=1 Tax=Lederbergia lenta TaxID=1467 RepID=UPI002040B6CE|nr:LysM peptidoglycan-binding domain-containing protein [Lederbergia lenta]MCM3111263.1 LysM peptidoglycan-binding domain-containing protein [Lederbergia lenta]